MEKELSDSGYDITPLSAEAIERLAQDLNEEEYRVLLDHGTEPAVLRDAARQQDGRDVRVPSVRTAAV